MYGYVVGHPGNVSCELAKEICETKKEEMFAPTSS